MQQFLEVGRVNNTHGIKGEVKLELWCDSIEYLKQFKVLYLDGEGKTSLKIKSVRPQKNSAILSLEGYDSIEKAEKIKGRVLYGDRNDAQIDENSNYIADLIGCYVVDIDTDEEYGQVKDVLNYGSCDIYDVENWGKHTLVPAVSDVVKEINIEYRLIKIKNMKGLFDED